MRRIVKTVSLVVCLAVTVGAPRGVLLAALAAGLGIAHTIYAQQPEMPRFDVVSIKRNTSGEQGGRNALEPGEYVGGNVTVRRLLALAFQPLPNAQIVGGPDWINSDRFDIRAKVPGNPPREQLQAMMRAMLEERFHMRTHRESRPTRIFALTQVRSGALGPSLKTAAIDCTDRSNAAAQATARADGVPWCVFQYTNGLLRGRGVTLDQIAGELTTDRVVVNRTGMSGRFDVDLQWTPDATQPPGGDAPPTLATALREQLGLRLETATQAMEYLVIDAIQPPEEN